jgi:hypothetical protein
MQEDFNNNNNDQNQNYYPQNDFEQSPLNENNNNQNQNINDQNTNDSNYNTFDPMIGVNALSLNKNLLNLHNNNENDYEEKDFTQEMRLGFIRKVYGILSAQLLITFLLVCSTFIPSVSEFFIKSFFLIYIFTPIGFIILIVLVCCKDFSKKVPYNYILLFIWTICEAITLCCVASRYNYRTVLTALGLTAGVVVGITVYAFWTDRDFTGWGMGLCIASFGLFFFGLFGLFFGEWVNTLYCLFGVVLFGIYLIYDTQLVLGKFGREYGIDDYIFAALNIYIDIINLFSYILSLLGKASR